MNRLLPTIALGLVLAGSVLHADINPSYMGLSPRESHTLNLGLPGVKLNTFNGNLIAQERLFFIPGRGLPLDCFLMYNSDHRRVSSSFGKGWRFSYHIRYSRHGNGDITVVWGSGRQDRFVAKPGSGGGFTPPTGVTMTLTEVADQLLLRSKYGLEYHFEDADHRKLTRLVDPNGHQVMLTYDGYARLRHLIDASGRRLELLYDAQDRVHTLRDHTGNRTFGFSFDAEGRLVQITDPLAQTIRYAYDKECLLTGITDKRGHATTISYVTPAHDPGTRLPQTIIKDISTTSFAFDPRTRQTTVTDARGETWTYTYDEMGRLTTLSDPHAKEISLSWDGSYNLTSMTNRNGATQTYTYDGLGNLLSSQDPFGETRSWSYEPMYCRNMAYTDARGNFWGYGYDQRGNLIEITDPLGAVRDIAYDAHGQPQSSTDPELHTTRYSYDPHGNMTTITDPLGHVRKHTYDALSREVETEDGNGHRTRFQYDGLNRLTTRTDHLGRVRTNVYDAAGNRIMTTDERGAVTHYQYDALGRRTALEDALGQVISYAYDLMGNLTGVTDKRGHTTRFTYDALGRMITRATPLGHTWTYTYDCEGRGLSRQDPKGQTITHTFDKMGRLLTRTLPGSVTTSYVYDANGNLVSVSRPASAVSFYPASTITRTYDALNRMVSETDVDLGMTLTLAYTDDGMLRSVTRPDGDVQSYEYDAGNRMTRITADGQQFDYAYDAANRRTQISRPTLVTDYTYDTLNRRLLTETSDGTDRLSQAFGYDSKQLTETLQDGTSTTYSYDLLGRITRNVRVGTPSYDFENTFDANGNKLSSTGTTPFFPTSPLAFSYDADNRIITETGTDFGGSYTRNFTYDDNGNLLQKVGTGTSTVSFGYGSQDEVVAAMDSAVGSESYPYDALGRLRSLTVASPAPGEVGFQRFVYDQDNHIILSLDGTGTILEQYWHNQGNGNLSPYEVALLNDSDCDGSDESVYCIDFAAPPTKGFGDIEDLIARKPLWAIGVITSLPWWPPHEKVPESPPRLFDLDGSEENESIFVSNFSRLDLAAIPLEEVEKPPKKKPLFRYPGYLGNTVVPRPPREPPFDFPRYPDDYLLYKKNTVRSFPFQDGFGNIMAVFNGSLAGLLTQLYDLLGRIVVFGNPGPFGPGGQHVYRARINSTIDVAGGVFENYTNFRYNQLPLPDPFLSIPPPVQLSVPEVELLEGGTIPIHVDYQDDATVRVLDLTFWR